MNGSSAQMEQTFLHLLAYLCIQHTHTCLNQSSSPYNSGIMREIWNSYLLKILAK